MKIFFITPTGGRTGSEMMLWYLLKYIKGKIRTVIYTRQNGELFAQDSPADETFINKTYQGFLYKIYEGVYYKLFKQTPEISKIKRIHQSVKPDFWYLNTMMSPDVAELAIALRVKYIVHVHELVTIYDEIRQQQFIEQLQNASLIICCSTIVQKRINQMGYQNTVLLHEYIDTSLIKIKFDREQLRSTLGIPRNAFVWLMSGSMNLRKGYDMVPDLLENMPENSYLVWLGSKKDAGLNYYLEQRVLQENLNFVYLGSQSDDYYDYFNIADGFVLTAREDPFPLVMIEAAFLQKPIVAFNSGGVSEFVIDGMGVVVDSFNPKDLANAMQKVECGEIKNDKSILQNRALEFDVKNQIGKWVQLFSNLNQ
ncbi:MAG: glycosyltransferase family 4 protein [Spirosomaceae bacterium]|nr:glycosyltransferase family 4 protein [Spirosomataceae bacterium]